MTSMTKTLFAISVATWTALHLAPAQAAAGEIKGNLIVEPTCTNCLVLAKRDADLQTLTLQGGSVGGDVVFKPVAKNALVLGGRDARMQSVKVSK